MQSHRFATLSISMRWEDLRSYQLVHPDSIDGRRHLRCLLGRFHLFISGSNVLKLQPSSILAFGECRWQEDISSGTSAVGNCSHQLHATCCYSCLDKVKESHSHPSPFELMFLAATSPRSFWDFSGCPSVAVGLVRAPGWLSAHLGSFPRSLILRLFRLLAATRCLPSKRETVYQWNVHNFRNILKRVGWYDMVMIEG